MCEIVRKYSKIQLNTKDLILLILWYSKNFEISLVRLIVALSNLTKYLVDDLTTIFSRNSDTLRSIAQLLDEKLVYVYKRLDSVKTEYLIKLSDYGMWKVKSILRNVKFNDLVSINNLIIVEFSTLVNDLQRVLNYVQNTDLKKLLNDLVILIIQYLQDKYSNDFKIFLFLIQDLTNYIDFKR